MNYCTKCQSIYSQPGTCNCFAPLRIAPTPIPFPSPTVWPPFVPYIGDPYPGTYPNLPSPHWTIWGGGGDKPLQWSLT